MVDDEFGNSELREAMEERGAIYSNPNPETERTAAVDTRLVNTFETYVSAFDTYFEGQDKIKSLMSPLSPIQGEEFIKLLALVVNRSAPTPDHPIWTENIYPKASSITDEWVRFIPRSSKWNGSDKTTFYVARAIHIMGITIEEAIEKFQDPAYSFIVWPNNLLHIWWGRWEK